jgi:hypothetical protein
MFVIKVDPGNDVVCDFCNGDYSSSDESGGVLVGDWAACPKCEGGVIEYDFRCPSDMSFREWVLKIREGVYVGR